MGIISRGHSADRQRTGATIIAAGTKLVGDLALSDSLHIDGRIEGSVQSDGEVSIGQDGRVEGDIRAARVLISGEFSGLIEADRLEIVSSGKVSGELIAEQLVIESGARFNGSSKVKGDQAKSEQPARLEAEPVQRPQPERKKKQVKATEVEAT